MKLLRYGPIGQERPGVMDDEGRIRDLSSHVADFMAEQLSPAGLAALAGIPLDSLPVVEGAPRTGAPVVGTRQFIAVGLNFSVHAAESNLPVPSEPILFTKAVSCIRHTVAR